MSNINHIIKNSSTTKKVMNILDSVSKSIPIDERIKEVEQLHLTRDSRTLGLSSKGLRARKLIEANLQDQSHRSRIVEINIQVIKHYNHLRLAVESAVNHFVSKYEQDIPGRSKEIKRAIVTRHFEAAHHKMNELETITEICEEVIKDIDQAAWSIERAIKGLDLATKREHTL